MEASFDVVVIGGGPAGCAAGIRLTRAGGRVVVLDKARSGSFCVGETLPPKASQLLAELGRLDIFNSQKHGPLQALYLRRGRAEPSVTDFLFSPYGNGWHIDRVAFNQLLTRAAIDSAQSIIQTPQLSCAVVRTPVRVLRSATGATFTAAVLIDASGRRACGIPGFPARIVQDHLFSRPESPHP